MARSLLTTVAFLGLSLLIATTSASFSPQSPLGSKDSSCSNHKYTTHILSRDPLVIYIPEFITPEEAKHLETITKDSFTRSGVADSSGQQLNATTRTSQSASLSIRDDIIRCIENRALAFQGLNTPRTHLEPLQLVKYGVSEQYHTHTDWFTSASRTGPEVGGNRLSSFFVYVSTSEDLSGGGTRFPIFDAPGFPGEEEGRLGVGSDGGDEWCDWINCDEEWENGITFRPVARNAVFWVNLLNDGKGDERTLHAGLPVIQGRKLGMNIWTREGPMSVEYRGED